MEYIFRTHEPTMNVVISGIHHQAAVICFKCWNKLF